MKPHVKVTAQQVDPHAVSVSTFDGGTADNPGSEPWACLVLGDAVTIWFGPVLDRGTVNGQLDEIAEVGRRITRAAELEIEHRLQTAAEADAEREVSA